MLRNAAPDLLYKQCFPLWLITLILPILCIALSSSPLYFLLFPIHIPSHHCSGRFHSAIMAHLRDSPQRGRCSRLATRHSSFRLYVPRWTPRARFYSQTTAFLLGLVRYVCSLASLALTSLSPLAPLTQLTPITHSTALRSAALALLTHFVSRLAQTLCSLRG